MVTFGNEILQHMEAQFKTIHGNRKEASDK